MNSAELFTLYQKLSDIAQLYPTVFHPVAEALAQTNVSESPQETP
jgi:hypothetical protein